MLDIGKNNSKIVSIIEGLLKNGRITEVQKDSFFKSYEQPTIQIGVVGKMNSGKSSLLNAIIFGKDILPAGSQPVTATLTKIEYGEETQASIEFLTSQDVKKLFEASEYEGTDPNKVDQKENALSVLESFPANYKQFLGKTIDNLSLDQLSTYVAAQGEYRGLVKFATLRIKNDNLRGVTIIDTPGFNDPVISRGEITKRHLSECHVVLFVHDDDGYDQTDAELLTTQIDYAGVSKLIDVFNKMDMHDELSLSEWDAQAVKFIETRAEYLSEKDHPISYALVQASDTVPVSAFMALCGMRKPDTRSDFVKRKIAVFEERYPELTAPDVKTLEDALVKYSNIDRIVAIINETAKNSPKYLMEKPILTIQGFLKEAIEQIESDLKVEKARLAALTQSKDALEADLKGFVAFMRSVSATVKSTPLKAQLLHNITSAKTDLIKSRERVVADITEVAYPEPSFLSSGITAANINAYNILLEKLQSMIRTELGSLANKLVTTCNSYVGNIILSLGSNPTISHARITLFENSAKNACKGKIQNVNINIPPYSIAAIPSGNQGQYSRLRCDLNSTYDDYRMSAFLKDFRDVSEKEIGDPEFILDFLIKMEDEMKLELSASPTEKEEQIKAVEAKIAALEKELKWAKEQKMSLNAK